MNCFQVVCFCHKHTMYICCMSVWAYEYISIDLMYFLRQLVLTKRRLNTIIPRPSPKCCLGASCGVIRLWSSDYRDLGMGPSIGCCRVFWFYFFTTKTNEGDIPLQGKKKNPEGIHVTGTSPRHGQHTLQAGRQNTHRRHPCALTTR